MLQVTELETKSAGAFARGAAINAVMENRKNASTYTWQERSTAQTALDLLDLAFACKDSYINYRKTFIAVKLEKPVVKSKKMLAEVESILEGKGAVKIVTAQGVTYRFNRKV